MSKAVRLSVWGIFFLTGVFFFVCHAFGQASENSRPEAVVLTLNGAVTPTVADYLTREIEAASDAQKELVIIEVDTPGGLVDSMKTIIKAILGSNTPVVTYVSPQGARSASAGLYIMYAAHISAMAPATNTGSATPIEIGGAPDPNGSEPDLPQQPEMTGDDETKSEEGSAEPISQPSSEKDLDTVNREAPPLSNDNALRAKIINDSVAYIRSLAELRGRNADWAEKAVREAANVPASEALELNVIDLVAEDLDELLVKIHQRTVKTADGEKTIDTKGILLVRIAPKLIETILGFFANPNVAAILMSLGTTGIIIEMWNPGSIFPGAIGLLSLLLGLYAFQVLPFNWLGIALIVAGVVFIALEAYTPTFGVLGILGLLCFGTGLYIVFPEGYRVSSAVIISVVGVAGGFLALMLFALVGSRSHGPLIGKEAIKHREGFVDEWDGDEGYVVVEGERWRARSSTPLTSGDRIKVTEVDGLVLVVRKASASGSMLLGSIKPEHG